MYGSNGKTTVGRRSRRRAGIGRNRVANQRAGVTAWSPAFEALERRELLTADLTSAINQLLAGQIPSPTTLNEVSIGGGFLTADTVTIAVQTGGQQGEGSTVSVSAVSATFKGGAGFSASITGDPQHLMGLSGTYTAAGQGGTPGYALTGAEVEATPPNVFDVSASGVSLTYDPSGPDGQEVAHLDSMTGTIIPFHNAAVTLDDLAIFTNGFTLGSGSITSGTITLGSVLSIDGPRLSLDGFGDVGGTAAGTMTLAADSVLLFPGNTAFTAGVDGFEGTYDFGNGTTTFSADDAKVHVGSMLDAVATGLNFTYDPSNDASFALSADSVDLTSKTFSGLEAKALGLTVNPSGLSIDNAMLKQTDGSAPIDLGGVIEASGLSVGVTGFQYHTHPDQGQPAVEGTVTVGADSVSLFRGTLPFSATVTGFGGTYDLNLQALFVSATEVDINVGTTLGIVAKQVGFAIAPSESGQGDDVTVHVGSATATLNAFGGISGSITDLSIGNDGFTVGSATLSTASDVRFGSMFTLEAPSVTLDGFGYSTSGGAKFNSDLTVETARVTLALGSVDASATGVSATLSFKPGDIGHFTFTADTLEATLGSTLDLKASEVKFDTAPADGGYVAQVGSGSTTGTATATLSLGGHAISGTASNFAISASGSFVALPGFGASLSLDDSSKVNWPSWLPIKDGTVALSWPDFSSRPDVFTVSISATVSGSLAGLSLSGSVQDAVIDTSRIESGDFPVTSLGGFGVSVGGSLFGLQVEGQLFLATLKTNDSFNAIPDGSTETVAHSYLDGGIEVGAQLSGVGGFEIRLGLSQLGLLGAFVDVDAPILLDPNTGLTLSDLHGGIEFDKTLPKITDPKDLLNNSDLTPPGQQTLAQWEASLATQAATQVSALKGVPPSNGFADLSNPMTIDAGASLYSAYASPNAFKLDVDLLFDTTGNFEVTGTLTLGDKLQVKGGIYIHASDFSKGNLTIDAYAAIPDPSGSSTPLVGIYGGITFAFGSAVTPANVGASSQLGSSLTLNGTSDYASADPVVPAGSSFSVEFWARRGDSGRQESVISQGDDSGLNVGFDAQGCLYASLGTTTVTSPSAADMGWHHWAVTFDATSGTLATNRDGVGVAQSSASTVAQSSASTLASTGSTLLMGKSGSTYFKGSLAEVRVWSVALTPTQINANMNRNGVAITEGASKVPNLLADWSFASGSGAVAADLSGGGHPASVHGSLTYGPTILHPLPPPNNTEFTITFNGEADLTLPGVPGTVFIQGSAVLTAGLSSLDFQVNGTAGIDPVGNAIGLAGHVHVDLGTSPDAYGIFVVNTAELSTLENLGIHVQGNALLQFNTTSKDQSLEIDVPDLTAPPEHPVTIPMTFTVPRQSAELNILGSASFEKGGKDWFQANGQLIASFTFQPDDNGQPDPLLDLYLNATLTVGPADASVLTLHATGFMEISRAGLAADFTASLESSSGLTGAGIDVKSATFTFILNTTDTEVIYAPPLPPLSPPNTPPSPTVDIPASPPGVTTPESYLEIDAQGELDVEGFTLLGSFSLIVSPDLFSVGLNMELDLNEGGSSGTTLAKFQARGGLILKNQASSGPAA